MGREPTQRPRSILCGHTRNTTWDTPDEEASAFSIGEIERAAFKKNRHLQDSQFRVPGLFRCKYLNDFKVFPLRLEAEDLELFRALHLPRPSFCIILLTASAL